VSVAKVAFQHSSCLGLPACSLAIATCKWAQKWIWDRSYDTILNCTFLPNFGHISSKYGSKPPTLRLQSTQPPKRPQLRRARDDYNQVSFPTQQKVFFPTLNQAS